jgi:hypothetical protein
VQIDPRAREAVAAEIEAQGPAYRNLAESVRAGWVNTLLEPALRALTKLLRQVPDDED